MTRFIDFILRPDIDGDLFGALLPPFPASGCVGEWYRQLSPNAPREICPESSHEAERATLKMCKPFVDAMCTGYVLPLQADVEIEVGESFGLEPGKFRMFSRLDEFRVFDYHEAFQLGSYDFLERYGTKMAGKFNNPWIIKTPPGYSTLFTQPILNQRESRFYTFSGVVDTDVYPMPVELPFVVDCNKYRNKSFVLERGTPVSLLFPFKRDSWRMTTRVPTQQDLKLFKLGKFQLGTKVYGALRTFWRTPRDFR